MVELWLNVHRNLLRVLFHLDGSDSEFVTVVRKVGDGRNGHGTLGMNDDDEEGARQIHGEDGGIDVPGSRMSFKHNM